MRNPFAKRVNRAAVLGCGPAGMFAAHAFVEAGWDVTIYSRKRMSHMFGAQYLHAPIPGLPERRTSVNYRLNGTAQGYADKVYNGLLRSDVVSPSLLSGPHDAWDIRAAYQEAYTRYEGLVINVSVTPSFLYLEFANPAARNHWGAVVSSIPATELCLYRDSHAFVAQTVWAAGDAPERGIFAPVTVDADTVICDGTDDRAWYRCSSVFGHSTVEWPERRRPPFEGVAEVQKPIGTTCDCYPSIVRVGRYGTWRKGVLAHHAYQAAAGIANGSR